MEFLPVLELIDRLCIARVKHRRTNGANQVELDWYEDKFAQLPQSAELNYNVDAMTAIHNAIWELEWQLKSGVEEQLPLEEIGRRAIRIRDYNNKRISFKNSIASLLGHPVREFKHDHLSEETMVKTLQDRPQ
jgi:hypothetical protein